MTDDTPVVLDEDLPKVDLGLDHALRWLAARSTRVGAVIYHRRPNGDACVGTVYFDVPAAAGLHGPRWKVESSDPLTLSPSIRCSCGDHGYIRAGKWVPA